MMTSEGPSKPRPTGAETTKGYCTMCARTAYIRTGTDFFCPVCSSPLFEGDQAADLESL